VSTAIAFLSAVALVGAFGFLLYRRRAEMLRFLASLPERLTVEAFGYAYTIDASVLLSVTREYVADLAFSLARLAPVLAIKGTLFALLVRQRQTSRALLAPIPHAYWDVAAAFHERTRETLSAIYVLQAATAAATFLVAFPIFALLGYDFAVTLALIAGLLQFLPIVGPSFLVAALAVYRLLAGEVVAAVLILVLGGVLIGWLPDAVVRPRLAQHTAHLPGSLYFVGFTGGLLSVGPIGFIAGPLVVALLVEATELLAAEVNGYGHENGAEYGNGGEGGGGPNPKASAEETSTAKRRARPATRAEPKSGTDAQSDPVPASIGPPAASHSVRLPS
jgi:predicted PurR-regulated permease PerM